VERFWEPAVLPGQESAADSHRAEGAGWPSFVKLIGAAVVFVTGGSQPGCGIKSKMSKE